MYIFEKSPLRGHACALRALKERKKLRGGRAPRNQAIFLAIGLVGDRSENFRFLSNHSAPRQITWGHVPVTVQGHFKLSRLISPSSSALIATKLHIQANSTTLNPNLASVLLCDVFLIFTLRCAYNTTPPPLKTCAENWFSFKTCTDFDQISHLG